MGFYDDQWHSGELYIQQQVQVPHRGNPQNDFLSPNAGRLIPEAPLLAVGTLSPDGLPWTSLLMGAPGFAQVIGQDMVAVESFVPPGDPIIENLGNEGWGSNGSAIGEGLIGGLAVILETRQRQKLFGRARRGMRKTEPGSVSFVMQIEQSMGNCPKYINGRHLDAVTVAYPPAIKHTEEIDIPAHLPQDAIDFIEKSDMFFISSRNEFVDMDTNHRGGPAGFVRVFPVDGVPGSSEPIEEGTVLVWPEYSGNRLYQTLGNLAVTPLAGLTFPDYATGDVLYLTGRTEILVGDASDEVMGRTRLSVKLTVTKAKFSKGGLPMRAAEIKTEEVGWSPYNPAVRYLQAENKGHQPDKGQNVVAHLVKKEIITPTIGRFTFELPKARPVDTWKAGQYVMIHLEDTLSRGYRHMDNSDPKSLNDDFIRSFTVSSAPVEADDEGKKAFELTIRLNGPVSHYLFGADPEEKPEIPVLGFGGEFFIDKSAGERVGIVAAGVGITPFIAQWKELMDEGVDTELFWTVGAKDANVVRDISQQPGMEGLLEHLHLFVTGGSIDEDFGIEAKETVRRRMQKDDLLKDGGDLRKWYLCTGDKLRNTITGWLEGIPVYFEDFNY